MSNHVTAVKKSGEGVIGTCSCKMKQAKAVQSTQEAEDWILWHEEQVRRARAGGEPVPQLTTVHKTYLANSQDMKLPEREREQWKRLADEVATRLGLNAPPSEQLGLFNPEEGKRR